MYIKKKDKQLYDELDLNLDIPINFDKFITKIRKKHNLIIKNKNGYFCTNCNNYFITNKKINEECKCPNCKQKLLIKSSYLKNYDFKDSIGIVQKYKDYYIIRYFELITWYNQKQFDFHYCEYGRKIYDTNFQELDEIVNNNINSGIGYAYVKHFNKFATNWHRFSSYYKQLGNSLIIYPDNLKSLLKGTKWQYSQLWLLARKINYLDISFLLRNYRSSIELLIKLGFYNLALCPKTFDKKGNFKDRFGVDKEFASFIRRYNLDVDELQVLKCIQQKDIKIIRYFKRVDLDILQKYKINLFKLKKLTDYDLNKNREYLDYLSFAKELNYNIKDKKILYPKHINEEHNRLQNLINVKKDTLVNKRILKKYKSLLKNKYQDKKYVIFPAKSISELIEESQQQNNCVKTYAERYSKGLCDIYFMRLLKTPKKSLVTIEVTDNKVVQQRQKNNTNTTPEQQKILLKWEKSILEKGDTLDVK